MTSVSYEYVAPFLVEDDDGSECEVVPVEVYARKWRHLSGSLYRVWLRLEATNFGTALVDGTLDESRVTLPQWHDAEAAVRLEEWVRGIQSAALPASAVIEAIGDEALTRVEEIEPDGDDLNITVRLNAPELPVTAEVGPATATFDPRGK